MFITEGIIYDVASKTFIVPLFMLPQHREVATHGLLFMLGGVTSRWKQTILRLNEVKLFCILLSWKFRFDSKTNK